MAIPAIGFLIGTPVSIKERVLPQTAAIELLPLLDMISETTRIVYGNSILSGIMGSKAHYVRAPCPHGLRTDERIVLASLTEEGREL